MKLTDIFKLSTRMFKTNKLRTILTILGIAVGIGTILFLVSLGYGLQKILIDQLASSDALLSMDIITDPSSIIKLDEVNLEKIKAIPGVEAKNVSPMFAMGGQIKINDQNLDIPYIYFASASYVRLSGIKTTLGQSFTNDDDNKIIVTSAVPKMVNLTNEQSLGKQVTFTLLVPKKNEEGDYSDEVEERQVSKTFEIAGIIDDDTMNSVFIPIDSVNDLKPPYYSNVKIKALDQNSIPIVKEEIEKLGFTVSAMSETIADANKIFGAINIILSVFGAVALVVSAIGMFNTMTIALLERTQEIGIMKALGASRRDIWKMFLAESVIIGFLGGGVGIIIGYMGKFVFNLGLNTLASSMGGQQIDLFYTPVQFVLFIMFFSTTVGIITGLYPAKRASQLNPLEALRYK